MTYLIENEKWKFGFNEGIIITDTLNPKVHYLTSPDVGTRQFEAERQDDFNFYGGHVVCDSIQADAYSNLIVNAPILLKYYKAALELLAFKELKISPQWIDFTDTSQGNDYFCRNKLTIEDEAWKQGSNKWCVITNAYYVDTFWVDIKDSEAREILYNENSKAHYGGLLVCECVQSSDYSNLICKAPKLFKYMKQIVMFMQELHIHFPIEWVSIINKINKR